jgi:adiponectin receptor
MINELVFDNYGDMFSMKSAIGYFLACGFFYLFGLYVYTVRCPERHHPGRFNVCGNSHQIWHGFVVLGVISTYFDAL